MESKENANQFPLQQQSDDKDKALPSQVLEYYKKYSQNRELPKYFCGTTSSSFKIEDWHQIPSNREHSTIVNTDEIYEETIKPTTSQEGYNNWTRPPLIGQDHLSEQIKIPEINVVSVCAASPTSSVASNRKLEWDNGADIGYSNVEFHKVLHKSISLPVLTNLEYGELRKNLLRLSPEGNIETPQTQQVTQSDLIGDLLSKPSPYSSSTSESIKSSNKNYISSSSSSVGPQNQYFSDSDSSSGHHKPSEEVLTFLKDKVGFPLAESTPIIRTERKLNEISPGNSPVEVIDINVVLKEASNLGEKLSNSCENLSSKKPEEGLKKWHSVDLNMVDQVSHYKNLKVLKLCISKPVVVECFGISNALTGENKFIQTSLPRNTSIAVQTDFDFTNGQQLSTQLKKDLPKNIERQSVLYICHSDSEKEKNTNSSGTQTNSGALSNCNSFEYLYGAEYDQNLKNDVEIEKSPSDQRIEETAVMDRFLLLTNLKRCPPKSDLTTLTPDSDKTELTTESSPGTSKESPLAELIASKPSEHLIDDLHKNLQLLQKIIKSKKYDSITKKYCMKKLVQKLVDSKYPDDSSESLNPSEKSEVRKYIEKEKVYEIASGQSEISSKNGNSEEYEEKMGLHENKPWLPIQQQTSDNKIKEKKLKSLQTQTFINEIASDINFQSAPSFVPYQDQNPGSSNNFVPIQIIHNEKTRLERNPLFTLTDHGLQHGKTATGSTKHDHGDSSNSTENELYEVLQPSASETLVSSSNSSKENGKKLAQSWREDKTRSEQLLEQKTINGVGDPQENKDHLVNFAKKEREHQITWINNEISHLSKLKKLLERRESPKIKPVDVQPKVLQTILEKPRIEDIKPSKKSTTVYIVTTEKPSSSPHSECDPNTCQNPRCRERFISPTPSSHKSSRSNRASSSKPKLICQCKIPPCSCTPESSTTNLKICKATAGNEGINLQNARLVSSEQFTTGSNENCRTSIRRYTFEVPLEENMEAIDDDDQPEIIECPARSRQASPETREPEPSSPKRENRLSCELVVTEEIVGGEKSRSGSPQRCMCKASRSTSPSKPPQPKICRCGENKKTQTTDSLVNVQRSCTCSSSSTSSESDSTSEASTPQLCRCCKRKCENMRRARLEENNTKASFCHPCYHQNKINPYCTYPNHVCRCYNPRQAETVQTMRKTIEALEDLEEEEEFCKCTRAKSQSSDYCAKCNCKLKKKDKKPKGGMAYVLTLEQDKDKSKKNKKKKSNVGEIKIKVVSPTNTNKQRGQLSNACSEDCRGMEESTKDNSTYESDYCPKKEKRKKKKSNKAPTLQEYLHKNNPNFVSAAEERRKCLLDLAYMREKRCQKYKQLLALTNGIQFKDNTAANNTKSQHVFSSKEMKQLTAKHYKKLPEVQQKLMANKERQIKKANQLLADIFNQKLRQQVLKGKHTIPPDASIINLV